MRITNGSTGIAVVAIAGYLAWHAWTGGRHAAVAGSGQPATNLPVGSGPVGLGYAGAFPRGANGPTGPTQGQLQTQAPYAGEAGPSSRSVTLPGFASTSGASCSNCGDDAGRVAMRSPVASQAWAQHWGVTPQDTTGSGRGVPYP
jgi:hypothetical protein